MLAIGVLIPLVCGTYDLAIGATANLCTITAVLLVNRGWSLPAVIVCSVLVGTAIGAINGLLVVKARIGSFITTLGTASVISAVQIIITDNQQPRPATRPPARGSGRYNASNYRR